MKLFFFRSPLYFGYLAHFKRPVSQHNSLFKGKNLKLFDVLSVFAACCCCWNTRGSRHGGGDELHVTFGEPASLSGLQFTQPPHVLLLQHCYYLHQIKSSVITIKTQQKEKEMSNQGISTSFLLKFRWFSFLALQGYKA